MDYLHQIPCIHSGLAHLLEHDPVFSQLDISPEELKWPYYGPGFPALVRIVIGQQLSVHAARTLWQRFEKGIPCITPTAVLTLTDSDMRSFGLSRQKASYIYGLAEEISAKRFDPDTLENLLDQEVYEAVTALRGFGNWSAEMYLMFCLARPDIWPPGDLGIQEGLRKYLDMKERPTAEQTSKAGTRFKPHRTAASILLWHLKGS